MKILCVCDQGNNRSVTFAQILKYIPEFETLSAGLKTNKPETLEMLFEWADKIIVPQEELLALIPNQYTHKIKFYDIGPDIYPRPFNKELYNKVKEIMNLDPIQ